MLPLSLGTLRGRWLPSVGHVRRGQDRGAWTSDESQILAGAAGDQLIGAGAQSAAQVVFSALMAAGTSAFYTSPDGYLFTRRTTALVGQILGLGYSPSLNLFVGAGMNGVTPIIFTSTDAITWTARTISATLNSTSGVRIAWSPSLSLFVVCGACVSPAGVSLPVATSPDGSTWTVRTVDAAAPAAASLKSVVWSPELALFVAVGANGTGTHLPLIYTSPDGTTWTRRDATLPFAAATTLEDVAWSPQLRLLVAVGDWDSNSNLPTERVVGPVMLYSYTGLTWFYGNAPTSPYRNDGVYQPYPAGVCWDGRRFVAAVITTDPGSSGAAFVACMASKNGVNWFFDSTVRMVMNTQVSLGAGAPLRYNDRLLVASSATDATGTIAALCSRRVLR